MRVAAPDVAGARKTERHVGGGRGRRAAVLAVVVALGLGAGHLLSRAFEVRMEPKTLSGLEWTEAATLPAAPAERRGETHAAHGDTGDAAPLDLRMVDAGGVGIPADTAAWGTSYSHATHAFDPLILEGPPWIEAEAAAGVREDWRAYLDRMARYGNNAVTVDVFLELILFDGLGDGFQVYGPDDPYRARHRAFRAFFGGLVEDAAERGMDVYLKTDLPALSPPLERHLVERLGGLDTDDPAFWHVYGAGLREIFRDFPGIAGTVVRIGEAGPLFNPSAVEYTSYMGVRTPDQLRLMLRTLLPYYEEADRTLIFRSWSVGLGELGDLHNDAEVYERVLGPVRSQALVVSTKFVQGDFFGFLPLNPTLQVGEHKRLIEYQARREYEGFGALPNWLGRAHAESLRQVQAANPNLVGVWTWAQEGGPIRAGPLSLYHTAGFWRWTDANVYLTSRLAVDPSADPDTLARAWAAETFGDDPEVVAGVAELLATSREALEKAVYIRPYAEQRVSIAGIETPPILWIFEWDVIGAWSSVLATLHRSIEGRVDEAVADGREAVALTRRMQADLEALEPHIGQHPDYAAMRHSLAYQESLFQALADYRALFLRYYDWLDGGGSPAAWQAAADRFQDSGRAHLAAFGDDLDAPAFDFAPALASVERAREGLEARRWARGLGVLLVVLFGLGASWSQRRTPGYPGKEILRGLWVGASQPYRLADELADPTRPAWAVGGVVVTVSVVTAALLLAGPAVMALGVGALVLSYTGALARSWEGEASAASGHAPAALGPLLLAALFVLAVLAVRGPDGFWYRFWTDGTFRTLAFGGGLGLALWALVSSHRMGYRVSGRAAFASGSVMMASGLVLLVLVGMLPDLQGTLALLDEPLHLLPMRRAIINGVTHYGGLSEAALRIPAILGGALLLGGVGLWRAGRTDPAHGGPEATPGEPSAVGSASER